jgi:hypothetical protein
VFLIVIFALGLGLFPTTAQFPDGASIFTQLEYLLLPALCLVCVLFGYIARITPAGVIDALEAELRRTRRLELHGLVVSMLDRGAEFEQVARGLERLLFTSYVTDQRSQTLERT